MAGTPAADPHGYLPKSSSRGGYYDEDSDEDDNSSVYSRSSQKMPPGTSYVVLPEVGNEVLQGHVFDLDVLEDQVGDLSVKIDNLSDLLDESMFAVDDAQDSNRIEGEIEATLRTAAIVHKRLTALPPGLEVADFKPEERELYNSVSSKLFAELNRISEIKSRFAEQQTSKLHKTMRILHPELTEAEIKQRVDEAIMNDDSSFNDSSSMFAQQIVDDRYKREEAKIALMYAREQKKELEQVERSIAKLHQMQVDLAALVQGQGEILDQMEMSISNAVQDSVKGLKMLEVAESHRISSRKKKIIIGIIVGVVIGITVITIIGVTAGVIAMCS